MKPLLAAAHAVPSFTIQGLGDLPGGSAESIGYGINDSDQVTGWSNAATGRRAFLWEAGAGMTNLGDLPGGLDSSQGYGVKDSGQVTGSSYASSSGVHAFLGMIDFNDVLLDGLGWTLIEGRAINSRGQITGYGINPDGWTEAFVLTP